MHVYNILKLASSVHLINHHRHAALALQPVDGRRVDGGIRPRVRELSTVDLQTGTCTTLLTRHMVCTPIPCKCDRLLLRPLYVSLLPVRSWPKRSAANWASDRRRGPRRGHKTREATWAQQIGNARDAVL